MEEETVKVVLDASYPYDDFMGWYLLLSQDDKDMWVHLAKNSNRGDSATELLTKKSMELYCLEMDVDFIPKSENFLEKMYRRLTTNLVYASLIERGLARIVSGKLSFVSEVEISITEKGQNYSKKKS